MKFKLNEVYSLVRSLPKLTNKELPIRISYRLLKLLKSCSEEMETLEKSRIKLIKKYASEKKDDKEKKDMSVSDKNKEKFQEEFTTLLEEEVEIDFKPIAIKDLGEITLTTNDLISLQKIIKEK